MNNNDYFLFELGTEELPPKSLTKLSDAFCLAVTEGLAKSGLSHGALKSFATPRRLAILIENLSAKQPDQVITRKGPSVAAAYDAAGNPSQAALGFARSCGVDFAALEKNLNDKGGWLEYQQAQPGKTTNEILPAIIAEALSKLPITRPMRWGNHDIQFIRPVKWVVMLYGNQLIDATILGLKTTTFTQGHRFHFPTPMQIKQAKDYEALLGNPGHVIADFAKRRETIRQQIMTLAHNKNAKAVITEELLDEVTALTEWPVALLGSFDPEFLKVPAEVLVSSMAAHQRAFHLIDREGKLLPNFITISNIQSNDPTQVIAGNSRVIRARLADAAFFYQADQKERLDAQLDKLARVIFQDKLGTLFDKSVRLAKLASYIAKEIGADPKHAERAALLAKADLMTHMVGEFPELQGVMGYYYALQDDESESVAKGIKEHYLPRFAKDDLPLSDVGAAVALADKLDTLVGIFGLNKIPTGDKDPFGLRRAALGIVRILIEKHYPCDLSVLLQESLRLYDNVLSDPRITEKVYHFIGERLHAWYLDQGIKPDVFAAVKANDPACPDDFDQRLLAVTAFQQLPEAVSLAAANKRVSNILKKEDKLHLDGPINNDLLSEKAECALASAIATKKQQIEPLLKVKDYTSALTLLAGLRQVVDDFFDNVMVMVDDDKIRENRLKLLASLRKLFLEVADISLL